MTRSDPPPRALRSVEAAPGGVPREGRSDRARLESVRLLFDPDRLRLARQLAGMKKTEIAAGAQVTPAAISQYELGQSTPTTETLWRLALTLGVAVEFLARPSRVPTQDASAAHFRSLRATSQLERSQAVAYAELVWQVAEGLSRWVRLPDLAVPNLPVAAGAAVDKVEEAAAKARQELGLALAPIPHLVRLVESRGVLAVRTPDRLSKRVDAFSHWLSGRPLVVLSSTKNDAARSRFDAAHELGHIVMHREQHPGSAIAERQAHLFASCFLAPPQVLVEELPRRADWKALMALKQHHGMSLKSLSYAAHRLGAWSEGTYQRSMREYARSGWNQAEPGDIGPAELPSTLGKAAQLLWTNGVSLSELVAASGLTQDLVEEVIASGTDNPGPSWLPS